MKIGISKLVIVLFLSALLYSDFGVANVSSNIERTKPLQVSTQSKTGYLAYYRCYWSSYYRRRVCGNYRNRYYRGYNRYYHRGYYRPGYRHYRYYNRHHGGYYYRR